MSDNFRHLESFEADETRTQKISALACNKVVALLPQFLKRDEQLSAETAKEIHDHLTWCYSCHGKFVQLATATQHNRNGLEPQK